MSKLIVEVCRVKDVKEHPNTDRLEILQIKGWDVVAGKDSVKKDDLVVFIPPDAVLPERLHKHLNITKYCAELPKNADGSRPTARRVKAARLRGVPSYGTIMPMNSLIDYLMDGDHYTPEDILNEYVEGKDACEALGITKWEPPIKATQGDAERDHPRFHKYTNIENWRNHPDLFTPDDIVICTEKIHGTNCRVGFGQSDNYAEDKEYTYMAGSHNVRKKKPEGEDQTSLYWMPFVWESRLKQMLFELWEEHCAEKDKHDAVVIVFGEIYGAGVQDMHYDCPNGKGFRAFDISIGGEYMGHEKFKVFKKYEIPYVPIVYTGPYDPDRIKLLTDGETNLGSQQKFKGREGIVITPVQESHDPLLGRRILKSVSVDYLSRKGGSDGH